MPRLFQRNSGLVQKQHVVLYDFQLTVFHSNLQPCGDKRTRLKSRVNGMSSPRTEHPMRAAKHTSCMSEINETHYYYSLGLSFVILAIIPSNNNSIVLTKFNGQETRATSQYDGM